MNVITTTEELANYCSVWATQPFVTVDLEFMREKCYYAKLCLIQVGSLETCAIIDPLVETIDLAPFFVLMQNPAVTKVFHSGRQDIEIIFNLSGQIPTPVFDTQIAGMVCGFGEAISYEHLVKNLLNIELDKTNRLSDWSLRPLKADQLQYALADVTHLVHIYEQMEQLLQANQRSSWIDEEMKMLTSVSTYEVKPEEAWLKIKHRSHNAKFLTILRELASWREIRSQNRNTPRHSIIRDEMLMQIATTCPANKEELGALRNLRSDIAEGKLGEEILAILRHIDTLSSNQYVVPTAEKEIVTYHPALYEFLKLLLKLKSQQEGVVARIIASDDELKLFSNHRDRACSFLSGWRREVFGAAALDLRDGKISLTYDPKTQSIAFGGDCSANQDL